jgi:hypothetical protein
MSLAALNEHQRTGSSELLKPEAWPTPKWHTAKKARRIRTYEEHFTFQLQARYIELENDFRSVLGNFPESADIVTAARISEILHSAREQLEQESAELLTVSSSLDLVERYMTWLYPPWLAKARINGILLRLESLSFVGQAFLIKKVTELSEAKEEAYRGELRSVLDTTIGSINAQVIQDRISKGLQINRLRALRRWGVVILVVFFAVSPFATNQQNIGDWPSQLLISAPVNLSPWMNALAMMTLGAVGGFLSGLLQAQSTQVTLTEYLESMLKLQLRPLLGALVALILYALLPWQILPGITIVNPGSYFFIAFLSGFSERYFLRLLKTEPDKSGEETDTAKRGDQAGRS